MAQTNGSGVPLPRKLKSWLRSFEEYCSTLFAPPLFIKWAGISTISGALERKVWTHTRERNMYPNLYVFLVGPPGVGKGIALDEVNKLWATLPDLFVAPLSLTTSSLVDTLAEAKRKIIRPTETPAYVEFHSLQVCVPELSDFIPMYETRFVSALQTLWDSSDSSPFGERRRTKERLIKIDKPQLGIIAGTTPSYLNGGFMPEGAWDQGFISRTIMVYAGDGPDVDIFATSHKRESLFLELKADLKVIHNLYGKLEWEPEAVAAFRAWVTAKEEPKPEHRKLASYVSRRKAQLVKLCMLASVSRGNDLWITLEDYQTAINWLLEVEFLMPDIFRAASIGGDTAAIDDCFYFVFKEFLRDKEPIAEGRLYDFLRQRVPSHSVPKIIEVMIKSRMIEAVDNKAPGGAFRYKPIGKQMHLG